MSKNTITLATLFAGLVCFVVSEKYSDESVHSSFLGFLKNVERPHQRYGADMAEMEISLLASSTFEAESRLKQVEDSSSLNKAEAITGDEITFAPDALSAQEKTYIKALERFHTRLQDISASTLNAEQAKINRVIKSSQALAMNDPSESTYIDRFGNRWIKRVFGGEVVRYEFWPQ